MTCTVANKRMPKMSRLALFLTFALACVLYGPGLTGPFVFDDSINFAPLLSWTRGLATWQSVVLENPSGPLGRPLSMLTFLASASINGLDPLYFKLFNLCLHLICGALGFVLLRWALRRDRELAPRAEAIAAALTAIWLLHPLHVSTVLYAVQRMAQLSTLFALASILIYVHARERLESDRQLSWRSGLMLFVAFPATLLLGMFSKENAAVAPILCLVLELAYFNRRTGTLRGVMAFHTLFVAIPGLLLLASLVLSPDRLLGGYETRDFTLFQRLLSQPRAMVDYLGMCFYPRGGRMGVFTDDFVVSTGLLTPPTTLLSIVLLAVISVGAATVRRSRPYVFAGWFFFLGAHAIESGILPLDLYYEHRNYLPSLGVLLALGGLVGALASRPPYTRWIGIAACAATVTICALLSLVTKDQVRTWKSKEALVEQALIHHPTSVRAMQARITARINKADYSSAMALLQAMADTPDPRNRVIASIDMFSVKCLQGNASDKALLEAASSNARDRLTVSEVQAVAFLIQVSRANRCAPVSNRTIAKYMAHLANSAVAQPDTSMPKFQLRYAAAILYSRDQLWPETLEQVELAAQPKAQNEILGLRVEAHAMTGNTQRARILLRTLDARVAPHDNVGQQMLQRLEALVDADDRQSNSRLHPGK